MVNGRRLMKKRCKTPGCPNFHYNDNGYCDTCKTQRNAEWKEIKARHSNNAGGDDRPSASRRGYDSKWRKFAREYLKTHTVCAICGKKATVVDHKNLPAQIMLDVFGRFILEDEYYQPLCRRCNTLKAKDDKKLVQEYFSDKEKLNSYTD